MEFRGDGELIRKIKLAFAKLTSYGARHLGPRSHILISKTIYLRFTRFVSFLSHYFCTDPINHNLETSCFSVFEFTESHPYTFFTATRRPRRSRLLSNDALPTHHDARRRRFRTSAIIASVKHVHYKSLSIDRRSQCFLLHSCVQFSSSFFLSFFSFLTTIFWTRSREKCVSLRRKEAVWEEIDINPNTCFQSLCFNILALIVLSKKNESPFVIDQKKNGITIRDEERNPSPSRC